MQSRSLFYPLAVGFFLFTCAAVSAQDDPPLKNKLGYGFAPGLVAGSDFVAGQLIVGITPGADASGVRAAAATLKGTVVKEIAGSAVLLKFSSEAAALILLLWNATVL